MSYEGNAFLGHAIAAAKVAPVGDGNSEIINFSVISINHGVCFSPVDFYIYLKDFPFSILVRT
jgi:hypothetical protein